MTENHWDGKHNLKKQIIRQFVVLKQRNNFMNTIFVTNRHKFHFSEDPRNRQNNHYMFFHCTYHDTGTAHWSGKRKYTNDHACQHSYSYTPLARSLTHSLAYSLTHSLTRLLNHSHSSTHTLFKYTNSVAICCSRPNLRAITLFTSSSRQTRITEIARNTATTVISSITR